VNREAIGTLPARPYLSRLKTSLASARSVLSAVTGPHNRARRRSWVIHCGWRGSRAATPRTTPAQDT